MIEDEAASFDFPRADEDGFDAEAAHRESGSAVPSEESAGAKRCARFWRLTMTLNDDPESFDGDAAGGGD